MRLWLAFLGLLPILLVGSGPGAVASTPALAPHNGLIAIYGGDGLNLVDPAAGSALTVPETWDATDAVWSSDGARLAMTLWGVEGTKPGVYTMKPDGSDRVLVATGLVGSPTWSPDGQWLAVVRGLDPELGEGSQLVVVSADGRGDDRVLLPKADATPIYFTTLAWSPDGKLIAFVGADGRVGLVTPDGEMNGVFDVNAAGTLSWSPDSSRLAFESFRGTKSDGRHALVVLDLATGKENVLLGEQDGARGPAWSPEGDQIAFLSMSLRTTQSATRSHSSGGEPYETHLWSMRPNGTKAHQLVKGEFYSRPSWGRATEAASAPAPAADQPPVPAPVAEPQPAPVVDLPPAAPEETPGPSVTSEPTPKPVAKTTEPAVPSKSSIAVRGSNGIYLVDPENAAAHKIAGTGDMIAPDWSPDESLLAVERVAKDGSSSLYTIKPDGTQPQLVLKNGSAPSWSPAGDLIFFVRGDDEALFSVRPDGSNLQPADDSAAVAARELAWRTDGSPIWFFDEESANSPGSFDTSAAEWAPDESRIAFIGALGPTDGEAAADTVKAGLWIVSAEGGAPQLLLEGASGRPSWP